MQLRILADDLTGAADSAARVRGYSLPAQIIMPGAPVEGRVVALTSDSRHLPPSQAAEAVRVTLSACRAASALWYKKIDSTLRGNLAAELDAMLGSLHANTAVVCPAFPAQGRGLDGGRLVTRGLVEPGADLRELLRAVRRAVLHLPLEQVRAGHAALASRMAALAAANDQCVIVADAISDADLATVEAATAAALPGALRCGSAGLVGVLAQRLAAAGSLPVEPAPALPPLRRTPDGLRALVVVGSGSQTARRQVNYLGEQGALLLVHGRDEGTLVSVPSLVVLHLPPPPAGLVLDSPAARAVAQDLAAQATCVIDAHDPQLVLLAGGDTALALLTRLGVRHLSVARELLPGMALALGEDASGQVRRFVLKPGSFGGDDALAMLVALAARE
jgi:D-threonate/D-erythronate kinase